MAKVIKWIVVTGAVLITGAVIVIYVVLSNYDFNDLKVPLANSLYKVTGRKLSIGGEIRLDIGLTPALVVDDITFENAKWGSRPELAKVKRFEIQVELIPLLSRNIAIKRLIMIEPDVMIESGPSGESNLKFNSDEISTEIKKETASQETSVKIPVFSFDNLQIRKGRFTFKNDSGKTFIIAVDLLNAGASDMDSPLSIDFHGSFDDKPFQVTGNLGSVSAFMDGSENWSVDLTIKGVDSVVTLKGWIRDVLLQKGLNITFSIDVEDLAKTARQAGIEIPTNQAVALSGKLADTGSGSYEINDFKLDADPNDLKGYLEVDLTNEQPRLVAAMTSNQLDIRSFMPKTNGQQSNKNIKAISNKNKVFSVEPLPLEVLNKFDCEIKFQAGKVLLPKLALNEMNTAVSLSHGKAVITPFKAIIGGGTVEFETTIDAKEQPNFLSVELKIDGLELGEMFQELGISDIAEGGLDMDIEVKSRGESVAALMDSLTGHTILVMESGRINNKYINILGADLASSVLNFLNPFKKSDDYTNINCLVSRFEIKNGIGESTVLVFDTDQMSVLGEGKLDFGAEELDLSLRPQPKKSLANTGISFSLSELAKPFKLGGTFAKPSLAIDPTQAAITIGKAVGAAAQYGYGGAAVALLGKKKSDKDPCLAALEAIKTGKTGGGSTNKNEEESPPSQSKTGLEQNLEDVSGVLKGLLGK